MKLFVVEMCTGTMLTPRFRGVFSSAPKAKKYVMKCLRENGANTIVAPFSTRNGIGGQWLGRDNAGNEWSITEETLDVAFPY